MRLKGSRLNDTTGSIAKTDQNLTSFQNSPERSSIIEEEETKADHL